MFTIVRVSLIVLLACLSALTAFTPVNAAGSIWNGDGAVEGMLILYDKYDCRGDIIGAVMIRSSPKDLLYVFGVYDIDNDDLRSVMILAIKTAVTVTFYGNKEGTGGEGAATLALGGTAITGCLSSLEDPFSVRDSQGNVYIDLSVNLNGHELDSEVSSMRIRPGFYPGS